jgi:hypothetical protein
VQVDSGPECVSSMEEVVKVSFYVQSVLMGKLDYL